MTTTRTYDNPTLQSFSVQILCRKASPATQLGPGYQTSQSHRLPSSSLSFFIPFLDLLVFKQTQSNYLLPRENVINHITKK